MKTQSGSSAQAPEPALSPWISEFLQAKRLDRGASEQTLQAYERDLKQLVSFLHEKRQFGNPIQFRQVTREDLEAFIVQLTASPRSIARKLSTIRQFFKFLALEKELDPLPVEDLASPKIPKDLPHYLTVEQMTLLLGAAEHGLAYEGGNEKNEKKAFALRARDRALIYLLYATGLRVSELCNLELRQVDLEESFLRVQGKGGKERIAPFALEANQRLDDYLTHHRNELKPQGAFVFTNHRGGRLSRQACWTLLKELSTAAGLPAEIHPHLLRHSFATHLLQAGMNLRSLQMLLGHSDLSTTQIYTHLAPEHLKEAHAKFHPRG